MATTVFDIGARFGRLTIIAELPKDRVYRRRYLVRCACGTEKSVGGDSLRLGRTASCGCYQRSAHARRMTTHGDSRGGKTTAEWSCWSAIRRRCYEPNNISFKYYGGRGINVCDRWLSSYENFLSDMGRRPSAAHSIDRIDVNGNYEPSNCRWATASEQQRNKRNSPAYRE